MSNEHLPRIDKQKLPSADETVSPEKRFQYNASTGLSLQQELAKKKKRTKLLAGVAGGAVILGGGIAVAAQAVGDHGKQAENVSDVNNTDPVKDALAVNGNKHPELANPDYDKRFGIRELNDDGTIDAAKLFDQIGMVEVPIANSDIAPMTEIESESTEHGRDVLGQALDSYLPNFEAIANLYNMNNLEVQMTRAKEKDIPEKQQLLLENANIQSLLPETLSQYASDNNQQLAIPEIIEAIGNTAPGDAGLRAVACTFYGETPEVCAQAQEEDPNFAKYSSAYDDEGKNLQEVYGVLSDGTEQREIRKDIRVGIVWVDAQGKKVSTSEARFTTQIGTMGKSSDDTERYLSFRMPQAN